MSEKKETTSRRTFFRTMALGAASAGAVAVTGGEVKPAEAAVEPGSAGYRETEHVKRVYQLQRF